MNTLALFLLRVLGLAAGLVFAASLAVVAAVLLVAWLLRNAWARLTGRPVAPFIVRIDPRRGFEEAMRRAAGAAETAPSRTPRADGIPVRPGSRLGDVTDVEPK